MTPGFHAGIPMADYLRMPAVSASLICTLVTQCPRAAWFASWLNPKPADDDSTKGSDVGSVAHAILLEGSSDCVYVVDAADWRTNAAKEARAAAVAAGKIALLPHQLPAINTMVAAAREFIASLQHSEPAIWEAFQPNGGQSELTMVWDDPTGVRCRARPDRISLDRKLIVDYKTGGTTAEPDTWGRTQMVKMGYYTAAAFYRRGVAQLAGVDADYVFLVQEQDPPFLCSLVGVDPAGYDLGTRKVGRGLRTWAECAQRNVWPAYPNRVCYAEIPPWEHAREEEVVERHAVPYDISKMGWQVAGKALGFDRERDPLF